METSPEGAASEPTTPLDPLQAAVAAEREEVRRMVEAGASSPEELRALAERMREQREREASVWAAEVKPGLVKARKGKVSLSALRSDRPTRDAAQRSFLAGAVVLAVVVLVLLASTGASVIILLIPLAGFLVYAYRLGKHPPAPDLLAPPTTEGDAPGE